MTTRPLNAPRTQTVKALDTVKKIMARDGWHDPGTGLKRRGASSFFTPPCARLDDPELADLYEFDWLARKIVRLINEDAWGDALVFPGDVEAETAEKEPEKEGLEKPKKAVDSVEGSKDAERWAEIDHFEGADDGAFLTAAHWARLYDFSLLLLGFDYSGTLETPVKGSPKLTWLEPIPGPSISVGYHDLSLDPKNPREYECPEYYTIIGDHRFRNQRIHKSRVIPFYGPAGAGRWLADQTRRGRGSRVYATKGALSALDPCQEIMQEYGLSWNAVSHLLQEASIPVWKLKGLINGLASGDPQGEIQARLQMQQALMSVHRAVMLDADGGESYDRVAARIQDVPEIIQALTFRIASAVGIPVGRLFGRIIGGLGDTGDSDRTMWLDNVQSYRTRTLEPRLRQVMQYAGISEWEFKPLDETTDSEALDVKQKFAQTVKTWFDMVGIPEQQLADLCAESLEIDKFVPEEPEPLPGMGGVDPLTGEPVEPLPPKGEPAVAPKAPVKDWDPDQPRNPDGTWGETGASGKGGAGASPKAKAALRIGHGIEREPVKRVLGKDLSDKDVERAIGVPEEWNEIEGAKWRVFGEGDSITVGFAAPGDEHYALAVERTFTRTEEGLSVKHDYFTLPKEMQGQGVGKDVLRKQLDAYEKLGVTEITLDAAWAGRAVWPKLGFEPSDPEQVKTVLAAAKVKGAKTLKDVAESPKGRKLLASKSKRIPALISMRATVAQVREAIGR